MEPVLDASPPSRRRIAREQQPCPECGAAFSPRDPGQLFCSLKHRRAWNNRWLKRGGVVAPLLAVARATRNGTRGRDVDARTYGAKAGRDADTLLRRYRAEDEAAGRMSWEEWLHRRYAAGFDPV